MGNETMPPGLDERIEINPKRQLARGDESVYVSMQDLDEHRRTVPSYGRREFKGSGSRFSNGDTLLARITPCLENGKTAYVDFLEEGEVAHGSTEFIVLSGKVGISNPVFVYYLARSPEFRSFAIKRMEGSSGRQRVPATTLKRFAYNLPSLINQRAIAHILGSLDDKIELNQQMNRTLEKMAQAIFKSWFIDFDPVYAKTAGRDPGLPKEIANLFPNSFEDSELGEIPKGWNPTAVSTLLDINPRLTLPKGTIATYVDMKALPTSGLSVTGVIRKEFKGGAKFQQYDVLLARITPCLENGKTGLVDFLDVGQVGFGSTEFIVLRGKNHITKEFVYCLARDDQFRQNCISSMVGSSGRQRVQNACFDHYKLAIAPEPILYTFAEYSRTSFEKIKENSRELLILSKLRDTLLPKLIFGELPIPDAEKILEGVE